MNAPLNIFVFGDIVLDHFIPVTEKEQFQRVGHERGFDGHPRRTIAGGAANCARLIAALGAGRVCLWGLSGYSPWGNFVQVLQRSQAADGAEKAVIYHGEHNDSHQMNTITRVVSIDREGVRHREYRVDDTPGVPVTESQRQDALAYLRAEADEHGVHAIILNDLDMKALNTLLIADIADIAGASGIPLFVDPKRDWEKYRSVHVTCALPNLAEWCYIVEDSDNRQRWHDDLATGRSLERMAIRSLRYMPNVDVHIIKCDERGVVVIGSTGAGRRSIYHVLPHPIRSRKLPGQLGAGDILCGALALEYAALRGDFGNTERILTALRKANGVVACYLEMDWQRVPNDREMLSFTVQEMQIPHQAEVTDGVILLPRAPNGDVDLADWSVERSGLVSQDGTYVSKIKDLVAHLTQGWDTPNARSAILTGRGGVGKSDLQVILDVALRQVRVRLWSDLDCSPKNCPDVHAAIEQIKRVLGTIKGKAEGLLVVIEEAFATAPHLLLGENGKLLLQGCARLSPRTRFLLVDADYARHRSEVSRSQFVSRCKVFELPSLATRQADIPYIFAASCWKLLHEKCEATSARISEAVLLSVINWVLRTPEEEQSPRLIVAKAEEVVAVALKEPKGNGRIPQISMRHVPSDLKAAIGEPEAGKKLVRFFWTMGEEAKLRMQRTRPTVRVARRSRGGRDGPRR